MCYEFQFFGNSRVICSELQRPAGSQSPSATAGSQDLAGSGVMLMIPQELHRSLQKAEQPLAQVPGSVQQLGALLCVLPLLPVTSCSFPVPELGSAGVEGVLEQLEGSGTAC